MKNTRDTSGELRSHFDSNSTFMTGHRIIKTRQPRRRIPDWARDDKQLQKLISRSFPYRKTSPEQNERAGRWARFIQLYFKMNRTRGQIMEEMDMSYAAVDSLCRAIYRAARGIRANGTGTAGGKVGRPKIK